MNTNLKRRALLGSAAALALPLGAGLARAQEPTLTILSHKVHETVSRGLTPGTTGGDIAGEWAKKKGVKLNWITGNIEPIHDRLFRELSLRETSIDLAFVINKFETPKISTLLEPLDEWQKKAPIEDFAGIPANLLVATRYKGVLTAVPFRHATPGLFWNKELFKERGLDRPPRSADELVAFARKMTYTRRRRHARQRPDRQLGRRAPGRADDPQHVRRRADRQGPEGQGQLAADDQGAEGPRRPLQGRRAADQLRDDLDRRRDRRDAAGAGGDGRRPVRPLHRLQQPEGARSTRARSRSWRCRPMPASAARTPR